MGRQQRRKKRTVNVFLTFEGIDGSGKSVQAEALVRNLRERNIEVCFVRDPGGPKVSERIRNILLDRSLSNMSGLTELLLYEAARSQLVMETIQPALQSGKVVVSDRFSDSTTTYQGYGRSIALDTVNLLNEIGCVGIHPARTYLLDITWEESVRRRSVSSKGNDRLETEAEQFYSKIRKGYRILAENDPGRFMVLDGSLPVSVLEDRILEDALSLIERSRSPGEKHVR